MRWQLYQQCGKTDCECTSNGDHFSNKTGPVTERYFNHHRKQYTSSECYTKLGMDKRWQPDCWFNQASVTDINGCRNSSNQLLIEAEAGEKLWLYPNPNSGQFQIRLYYPGVTSEKRRIQIFTSAGSEVMSRDIMLSNVTSPHYQRFDIDLSFQPAGIYLVKVIDMYTKKAVSGFVIKQAK